ncbi:PAS domain S-box protein [candidate division WOR-3 bacterium]|nr:PAS domain S-box protein [candidate division WOR-3 bacterium]
MEKILEKDEEKYRFLVDNSKEIIIILSKTGKILFANRRTLSILGYSEKEIIGRSITHFLTKGFIRKAFYALAQEFLGHPYPEMGVQVKAKSGEIRYLEIAQGSAPIRKQGKLIGVIAIYRDITERKRAEEKLKRNFLNIIHRLTIVSEYKDRPTTSHVRRIGYYCRLIAEKLGLTKEDQETIFYASPMHDIGKIVIPINILLKTTKLTPEEFSIIKTHTTIGSKILHGSTSKYLQMAEMIALTHHERWQGGGYPRGLKGKKIPVEGRIMNIADQYDAMRSKRPYKPAFSHKKVFRIITDGDGRTTPTHFDPRVLEIFKQNHKQFEKIYEKHKD